MIGSVVETMELLKTVVASLIAGVGVTLSFSLVILGAARFATLRREERPVLAFAAATLSGAALLITLAGIVLGILVMTAK